MRREPAPLCTTLLALGAIGTFLWQVAINVHPRICASEQRSLPTQPGWAHTISYEWHEHSCCKSQCYNTASQQWYCCVYEPCFNAGINVDMYQRDDSSTVPSLSHLVESCELSHEELFNSASGAVDAIAADYPLNGTFAAWYAESSGCSWMKSNGTCIGAYFATIVIAFLGSCCSILLFATLGYGLDVWLARLFCRAELEPELEPAKSSRWRDLERQDHASAPIGPPVPLLSAAAR